MANQLLTYQECIDQCGSDYRLKEALKSGKIYKIEKGIYAYSPYVSELEIISAKYPDAVFTMDSALYYHGLTDEAPELYHLATHRSDARIKDNRVKQYFVKDELFDSGITEKEEDGCKIRIYSLERMLIELIRNHTRLPYDYYKEVIRNYRSKTETMDFTVLYDYAGHFSLGDTILKVIEREVL